MTKREFLVELRLTCEFYCKKYDEDMKYFEEKLGSLICFSCAVRRGTKILWIWHWRSTIWKNWRIIG